MTSSTRAWAAALVPKPMVSAKVYSWMEILFTGTPRPRQSGWAALAGAAATAKRHSAAAKARRMRADMTLFSSLGRPPLAAATRAGTYRYFDRYASKSPQ